MKNISALFMMMEMYMRRMCNSWRACFSDMLSY